MEKMAAEARHGTGRVWELCGVWRARVVQGMGWPRAAAWECPGTGTGTRGEGSIPAGLASSALALLLAGMGPLCPVLLPRLGCVTAGQSEG